MLNYLLSQWSLFSGVISPALSEGWRLPLLIVTILLCAVVGYLVGSLNFAVIISRKLLRRDIRAHGSHNAGTTNMLRTYGTKYAVMTMVLDMLKGAVAAMLGFFLLTTNGAAIAGFFCVLGHMFPLYYGFKGGKGVATTAMVVLMIEPFTFVTLAVCFFGVTLLSRFVSLGSIMSALVYPLALNAFFPTVVIQGQNVPLPGKGTAVIMAMLTSAFVIYMHRENIKRLRAGKENKISFGKKKKDPSADGEA